MGRVQTFLKCESGAASADFLVIVAVSVGVTLAAIATIAGGAIKFGDSLEDQVAVVQPGAPVSIALGE